MSLIGLLDNSGPLDPLVWFGYNFGWFGLEGEEEEEVLNFGLEEVLNEGFQEVLNVGLEEVLNVGLEEVLNVGLEEEVLNEGLGGETWTMTQLRSCLESDQVGGLGLETMFGTLLGLLAGDDEDFGDGEENLKRGRSRVGGRCDRCQCSIPWGTFK